MRKRQHGSTSSPAVSAPSEHLGTAHIEWLLDFLRRDFTTLPAGELLAQRSGVFLHLHESEQATLSDFAPDEMRALGPLPPRRTDMRAGEVIAALRDLLGRVQGVLCVGIETLQQTGVWRPFALGEPAPHWSLELRPDGSVRRSYMGMWATITLATAADLLLGWWPRLRRCRNESCRAWFLPARGRQQYHDERCSARARYERFKPTRNYKAEYARRYDSTRVRVRRKGDDAVIAPRA